MFDNALELMKAIEKQSDIDEYCGANATAYFDLVVHLVRKKLQSLNVTKACGGCITS